MSLRARPPAPSGSSGLRSFHQERCGARCTPLLTSLRDSLRLLLTALRSPLVLRQSEGSFRPPDGF